MLYDMGISPVNVLRRVGLPDDTFARTNDSIDADQYIAIWRAIEAESNDPLLSLHLGQGIRVETFDPLLFAAIASVDLRQAIERMTRYKRLLGMPEIAASQGRGTTRVGVAWPGFVGELPTTLVMLELVFVTCLGRLATRGPVAPTSVHTRADVPEPERFAEFFGCPVEIGEGTPSMVFADEVIERPFLTANAGAWSYFEPSLRPGAAGVDPDATMSERVRTALLESLPGNRPSIDAVCRKLAVSRRTLQRRLREESHTFQTVLDGTRLELANWYLASSKLPHAEIAYLLGFEEPNSFIRAYTGWTGTTPDKRRRGRA